MKSRCLYCERKIKNKIFCTPKCQERYGIERSRFNSKKEFQRSKKIERAIIKKGGMEINKFLSKLESEE